MWYDLIIDMILNKTQIRKLVFFFFGVTSVCFVVCLVPSWLTDYVRVESGDKVGVETLDSVFPDRSLRRVKNYHAVFINR